MRVFPYMKNGYAQTPGESAYPSLWYKLKGAWPFGLQGRRAIFHDFKGLGYNASIVNGATLESRGGYRGLLLDGTDDSILIGDHSAFTFSSGGMTLSAWVWRDSIDRNEPVISKYARVGGGGEEYTFGFYSDGQTHSYIADFTNGAYIGRYGAQPSSNAWHHVAMTYDGGTTDASIRQYIDSVRTDTADLAAGGTFAQMRDTAEVLTFGAADNGLGGPFSGMIDDVLIYNRALRPNEIALLYNIRYAIFMPKRRVYAASSAISAAASIYYRMCH